MHNKEDLFRKYVLFVALANLSYFFVEFFVAREISSASLFADSVDFLEDASVNSLIFIAVNWTVQNKARLGKCLAIILVVPALAFLYTAIQKFYLPIIPEPSLLSLTGLGALLVNMSCALILARFRYHQGNLTKAAFLSARNDAIANIGIIITGLLGFIWPSMWPDLIVGFLIMVINLDAAKEIWDASGHYGINSKP